MAKKSRKKSDKYVRKQLTEAGVAKLKPPAEGQVDYLDTGGKKGQGRLMLRLNYGGAKVWRVRHFLKRLNKDGKRVQVPTTYKLGSYPALGVKEARDAAIKFLADPATALAPAPAETTDSFREVAEEFVKRYVEAKNLRSQPDIERIIGYINHQWGEKPFRDIRRSDVAELLDTFEDNRGKRQADVALAIIRKMANWYATRHNDYTSPVVKGMNRANAKESQRSRTLGDHEIRALWQAADQAGTYGALLKTLLLTAQRKDKVATMRWDDIIDGVWRIPYEKREKHNARILPLPRAALDIVEAQPRIAGSPYVFAAGKGSGHFNSFSQRKEEISARLPEMEGWVIHDLRRTAKTLMARAGVLPHISERVLGHVIGGVEGVYDQHDYGPEKADALARLAALVGQVVNPPPAAEVTQMEEHRRRRR